MKTSADYPKAIKKAVETLSYANITSFPLDLDLIHKRYENLYELRTYADFMKETGMSRQECICYFKSEHGATCFNGTTKCTIYYNELDSNPQHLRFTIAHEIGHVILEHPFDFVEPTEEEENILEKEADCFAGNLLCPVCFVTKIFKEHDIEKHEFDEVNKCYKWYVSEEKMTPGRRIEHRYSPAELLQINFDISHKAACTRIDLLAIDIKNSEDTRIGISYVPIQNAHLTAKWHCSHCNTEKLHDAVYCSECGSEANFFYATEQVIEYRHKIKTTDGRFDICPICGNTEFAFDSLYCMVCGSPRQNYCTNKQKHRNHPQARFCKDCGKETIYSRLGLTYLAEETLKNESYAMSYRNIEDEENGIPERCPICNKPTYGFKKICDCGFALENKCTVCGRRNTSNARYCEYCGEPTVFYKNSVLKDWHEIKQEITEGRK